MIGDCQVLVSSDDPPKVLKTVEDDKVLIACGSPTCGELGSATFDVQIRIHGAIDFRHCGTDSPAHCVEITDFQSVDFTISLTDIGGGVAQYNDVTPAFGCSSPDPNLFFDARLLCCNPPVPGFPCGICWQPDYRWQIRLFVNAFFCNSYTPADDCAPPDDGLAVTQLAIFDTDCLFNATYGVVQLAGSPIPNGTYTGTTSMTNQGGIGASCDSRPPVNPGVDVGSLVIDWQAIITP